MEIEIAREIGFCSGVRKAVDMIRDAAKQYGGIETLGAVVHNRLVIDELARTGARVVNSLDEVTGKVIAVSSHGVPPQVIEEIAKRGLHVIDATCHNVRTAQKMGQQLVRDGFFTIVFGEVAHPEVKGILGWAGENSMAALDAAALPVGKLGRDIAIISQTTQSATSFSQFVSQVAARFIVEKQAPPAFREIRVVNTICQATGKRQRAAFALAGRHDIVFIVGGRNSSNTMRLAETCRATGVETHMVETAAEIDPEWLKGKRSAGVAAGTSTPDQAIDDIVAKLKTIGETA